MKVLITGASSGIGKDMAKYLSSKGYDLAIVARNEKALQELKEELKTNVEVIPMDLSIEENCYKLHDMVKDVDILINNAGFGIFGDFTETDINKEISLIKTNIIALQILTKLYLKDMKKADKGRILNVASIAGFMPGPLMATYYASKNYVVSLTRAIRIELKKNKSNVKVHLLCPGPVDTNFNNVANVEFKSKGLSSDFVAKYAIDKMLNNKFIIIPGITIKFVKIFSKILPTSFIERACFHMQILKK